MKTNEILKEEIKKLEEDIYELNTQILTYYVYCEELNKLIFNFIENLKFRINEFENEFKTILESEVSGEELKNELLDFTRNLRNRINEFSEDYYNEKNIYKKLDILKKENELLKAEIKELKITIENDKEKIKELEFDIKRLIEVIEYYKNYIKNMSNEYY